MTQVHQFIKTQITKRHGPPKKDKWNLLSTTPAGCVNIALHNVYADKNIDLVIRCEFFFLRPYLFLKKINIFGNFVPWTQRCKQRTQHGNVRLVSIHYIIIKKCYLGAYV